LLVAAAMLLLVVGANCGETSSLTASGYLLGPFTKGGQVLDGTSIPPTCGQMEGKFGSSGGYVLLELEDSKTTLKVNFKRMDVIEPYGNTEKQTWDRTYRGPAVPLAEAPNGPSPGKYIFAKLKLDLISGADWQEGVPIDPAAVGQIEAAGLAIGSDGMIHGKAAPPPPGGGSVILDGTLLCEGGGWFGVPN
jgi:hypothetical protein